MIGNYIEMRIEFYGIIEDGCPFILMVFKWNLSFIIYGIRSENFINVNLFIWYAIQMVHLFVLILGLNEMKLLTKKYLKILLWI